MAMSLNEYQELAARTIDNSLEDFQLFAHSLHGMAAEVGEIHGIVQKHYQGHEVNDEHMKKEAGDLLWFIAEFCTSCGWTLEEVAAMNIAKLKARYPDGFEAERSLHRQEGDV
jgi:NTP pyrophosphatase (non-canonical NTP hydrolase)